MPLSLCRVLIAVLATGLLLLAAGCERSASESAADTVRPTSTPSAPATAGEAGTFEGASTPAASAGTPRIAFASLTHDFGHMSETETRTTGLTFTNAGDGALVIDKITTTCGCTTAQPDKKRYEPGESGTIEVTFDPSGPNEPGKPQRKYVNIVSNGAATDNGVTSIAILADVEAFINIEPRFLQLGTVTYGQPHEADITVSSSDPDFTIDSVTASNAHVTTEVIDVPTDTDSETSLTDESDRSPLTKRIVRMHIDAQAPWGGFLCWLSINVTGRPSSDAARKSHLVKIRVQGQVFGALGADPNAFRFGVQLGEEFEREMTLSHGAGMPFEIISAAATCSAVTEAQVETRQLTPDSWLLIFRATAGANVGSARGVVTVTTSVNGPEASLDLPIIGVVRPK